MIHKRTMGIALLYYNYLEISSTVLPSIPEFETKNRALLTFQLVFSLGLQYGKSLKEPAMHDSSSHSKDWT